MIRKDIEMNTQNFLVYFVLQTIAIQRYSHEKEWGPKFTFAGAWNVNSFSTK